MSGGVHTILSSYIIITNRRLVHIIMMISCHRVLLTISLIYETSCLTNPFGRHVLDGSLGLPVGGQGAVASDQATHGCFGQDSRDQHLPQRAAVPRFGDTAGYLDHPDRHSYLLRQFQLPAREV